MTWELIVVALVGGLLSLDHTAAWQTMVSQPLVVCPIIGLITGDPSTGLFLGAVLQMVWLAEMPLGSSFYPESTTGSIAGALLGCLGRARFDCPELPVFSLALLFSLVFSWIGAAVEVKWIRRINGVLSDRALRSTAAGRAGDVTRFTLLALLISFAKGLVITALAYVSALSILSSWRIPAGHLLPSGVTVLVLTAAVIAGFYLFRLMIDRRNWLAAILGLVSGMILLRVF